MCANKRLGSLTLSVHALFSNAAASRFLAWRHSGQTFSSSDIGLNPRSSAGGSAGVDGHYDVACLLLRLDVPGRLGDLFHAVPPVDDCPVVPGLNKLLKKQHIRLRVPVRDRTHHFLALWPDGPNRERQVPPTVCGKVASAG